MSRRLSAALLALLLASCVIGEAPPVVPWVPAPPGPTAPPEQPEPPPRPDPTEPVTMDGVAVGMTRAEVEAVLGAPTEDLPDNPGEDDLVRYDVAVGSGEGTWFLAYRGGRLLKARLSIVVTAP